jgi:hypothetical protein
MKDDGLHCSSWPTCFDDLGGVVLEKAEYFVHRWTVTMPVSQSGNAQRLAASPPARDAGLVIGILIFEFV